MRKNYWFAGAIRSMEVTHRANGFQLHLHIILLLRRPDDAELSELEMWLSDRWARATVRILGESARPSAEHGIDLRTCAKADYVAKLGLEVTAPAGESGHHGDRSPIQVTTDFAMDGDEADWAIWPPYRKGMFGGKMLTSSRRLRKAARFRAEKSDEDIIQREKAAEIIVGRIAGYEWDALRDILVMKIAILIVAEAGGSEAVELFLLGKVRCPRREPPCRHSR